ncbi:uncharacterized protein LOC141640437 [Silene latifolia]|uniref:uncharacterized protein LOC141640437 n=1 Tax=Silene latifolia TaxID=37657 RepID=UPI003D789D36
MGVSPGLEEKVDNIVSTLRDMLSGRQMATVCGICATEGHPNDLCPYLRESGQEVVNGVWESTTNNRKWDPYSKTYNEGWKAHPNFRWGNSQAGPSSDPPRGQFLQRPQGQQFNQQVPQQAAEQAPPSSSMSTEDMIRALTLSVTQDRADNKQNFKNLENQVSQLATAINRLEARDSNALPSQMVVNLRENEEIVIEEDEKASNVKEKEQIPSSIPKEEPEVPFPDALKRTHHFEHDKDIYEVFQKCEVNIPLLNLLKSVPKYAKFLKELCTIKRNNKLKGMKKVKGKGSKGEIISEYVSALFQKKLPPKCGDPGMFAIPCTIGDLRFEKAMLDLGASINVIPFSIYETKNLDL